MTTEKIQDELKELKEAHAADEGIIIFFIYVLISLITIIVCCVSHSPFFLERHENLECTLNVNFFGFYFIFHVLPLALCWEFCLRYFILLFPLSGSYL